MAAAGEGEQSQQPVEYVCKTCKCKSKGTGDPRALQHKLLGKNPEIKLCKEPQVAHTQFEKLCGAIVPLATGHEECRASFVQLHRLKAHNRSCCQMPERPHDRHTVQHARLPNATRKGRDIKGAASLS